MVNSNFFEAGNLSPAKHPSRYPVQVWHGPLTPTGGNTRRLCFVLSAGNERREGRYGSRGVTEMVKNLALFEGFAFEEKRPVA
jgi:hypothetical protein